MDLAKAKLDLVRAQKKLGFLQTAKSDTAERLGKLEIDGISVCHYRFYEAYVRGLDDRIVKEKARANDLEQEIEKKNSVVQERRMNKEILETMRSHEQKKHVETTLMLEQKTADELANLKRYVYKK